MPVHCFWVFGLKPGLNSNLFACFKKEIGKKEEANLPFQPNTAARNRLCPSPVLRRGPFL
jgi:hypothetical protein